MCHYSVKLYYVCLPKLHNFSFSLSIQNNFLGKSSWLLFKKHFIYNLVTKTPASSKAWEFIYVEVGNCFASCSHVFVNLRKNTVDDTCKVCHGRHIWYIVLDRLICHNFLRAIHAKLIGTKISACHFLLLLYSRLL